MKKAARCAIYCRSGGKNQSKCTSQVMECRSFINRPRTRKWRECPNLYVDIGISGMTTARPALLRLLNDATRGKFEIVVCEKVSRLGRNTDYVLNLLNTFRNLGVSVYTCS